MPTIHKSHPQIHQNSLSEKESSWSEKGLHEAKECYFSFHKFRSTLCSGWSTVENDACIECKLKCKAIFKDYKHSNITPHPDDPEKYPCYFNKKGFRSKDCKGLTAQIYGPCIECKKTYQAVWQGYKFKSDIGECYFFRQSFQSDACTKYCLVDDDSCEGCKSQCKAVFEGFKNKKDPKTQRRYELEAKCYFDEHFFYSTLDSKPCGIKADLPGQACYNCEERYEAVWKGFHKECYFFRQKFQSAACTKYCLFDNVCKRCKAECQTVIGGFKPDDTKRLNLKGHKQAFTCYCKEHRFFSTATTEKHKTCTGKTWKADQACVNCQEKYATVWQGFKIQHESIKVVNYSTCDSILHPLRSKLCTEWCTLPEDKICYFALHNFHYDYCTKQVTIPGDACPTCKARCTAVFKSFKPQESESKPIDRRMESECYFMQDHFYSTENKVEKGCTFRSWKWGQACDNCRKRYAKVWEDFKFKPLSDKPKSKEEKRS